MGISIRAYARHRGVSDAAVRKAIKAGRITPDADGTVDAARADAQWIRRTDPDQQRAPARETANEVLKAQTDVPPIPDKIICSLQGGD
jgi:hypothetical protein